jgi:cytochrome P450 PksS
VVVVNVFAEPLRQSASNRDSAELTFATAVGYARAIRMARIVTPDLASPRFKANPHPFYARLRAEAPVHRVRLSFWLSAWLVTRYDDAVFVLKDGPFSNDFYRQKLRWLPHRLQAFNRHVLNADPPDHSRLRGLVGKAFTPRAVEQLRGRIEQVCEELLDAAQAQGRLEVVKEFALRLPLTIIADMLGVPDEDRRRFDAWTKRVAAGSSGAVVDFIRAQPALWQGIHYLHALVAKRRTDPRQDMVTALLRAEEAGDKLGQDEVIGMIALLLIAGFETTLGLIASGTLALLQDPEQRERFMDEPALAESAVEELLRYTSPTETSMFRVAREDVTLANVTIPRGDVVLAVLGSANRDESHFKDPNSLDLAREPNRHLAFGIGAHFCLGAPLARLEGRIALTRLFRRFPRVQLAVPAAGLRWRRGLFFRSLEGLPVSL